MMLSNSAVTKDNGDMSSEGILLDSLTESSVKKPSGELGVKKQLSVRKPGKELTAAVWDEDESTVDQWILYLKDHPKKVKIIDKGDPEWNPLHIAVYLNNVTLLEKLVEANSDLECCTNDSTKCPPLVFAAKNISDRYFSEDSADGQTQDDNDQSEAVVTNNNHKTTFHALLQCSVDVNACDRDGHTALHVACKRRSVGMVNELLHTKDIDVNKMDKRQSSPLHIACAGGNKIIVRSLIKKGADPKSKNDHGMHPLHVAVVHQHLEVVEMILTDDTLLECKEDLLKAKDDDGNSTFLLAVKSGEEKMVEFFLENCRSQVTITDKNKIDLNAFHLAAANNKQATIEMICKHDDTSAGGLLNEKDAKGCTPLHHAAKHAYDQVDALTFLIERSVDLEQRDRSKRTPLLAAAAANNFKVTEKLLSVGANVTVTDEWDQNIIHLTATYGAVDVLKKVLEHKDAVKLIDAKDCDGWTPLHTACLEGHYEIASELLKNKAKMTIKDKEGFVPLHYAARHEFLEIVTLLVDNHADIDPINDENGLTPLTCAAAEGHEVIVDYLLESGADIDGKFHDQKDDSRKTTPLIAACVNGHVGVIEHLLKDRYRTYADVRIEAADIDENADVTFKCTCLVFAILHNQRDAALAILKSDYWKSAMKWRAETDKYGCYTTLKLLIKRMPDVARVVLDNCITKEKNIDGTWVVKYDYRFLENTFSESDDDEEFLDDDDDEENSLIAAENDNETKKWCFPFNLKRNNFKKEAHALQVMVDSECIDLLHHPLAARLLNYKWKKFGFPLYLINLFTYLIFLGFLTAFALASPTPKSDECITKAMQNYSIPIDNDDDDCKENYQSFLRGAAVIIILFSLFRIFMELIQMYYRRQEYFLELDNWMEDCLFTSSIIFVYYGLQPGCQCPESWQWQFGAFTLLLAWLDLVLFLKKFPDTGVYVLMFVDILQTFMKMILLSTLFVISFGLTFYMIFFRPGVRSAFSSPARSVVKTMVMTTGELDFDGIFFNSQEDADEGNSLFYPYIAYSMWIVFIILMPIILTNLLIGLAVDDIKGIQDIAALKRLALKVDLTLHVEESFIHYCFNTKETTETVQCNERDSNKLLKKQNNQTNTHRVSSMLQSIKKLYMDPKGEYEDNLNEGKHHLTTTEQVKEEIAQLKTMIKDMREKAKTHQNKNLLKIKAMIADTNQATKSELEMVAKQNAEILKYFKQMSKHPDMQMTADSASEEVQIGESTERDDTLETSTSL